LDEFLTGMAHNVRGISARRHESKKQNDEENIPTQRIPTYPIPAVANVHGPTVSRKRGAPATSDVQYSSAPVKRGQKSRK